VRQKKLVGHDIIVVGASAGGVPALISLCQGLPRSLPAAVFVVVHTSPTNPGILPQILNRAGPLPVVHAEDGKPWRSGKIYIAPPNHHMLLVDGTVRLTCGPKENGFRPAVDPLFRTAANQHGPRVIGVVLSGGLDDGTEGLLHIKGNGGITVVQDPKEADVPSMPESAIESVHIDHIVGTREMGSLLTELAHKPASRMPKRAKGAADQDPAVGFDTSMRDGTLKGPPVPLQCPDCGGALWEIEEGRKVVRYRCHVGHNYSAKGLLAAKDAELESAMWSAVRSLEEAAELRRRLAKRAAEGNMNAIAERYQERAEDAERRAMTIRHVLMDEKNGNGNANGNGNSRPLSRRPKKRASVPRNRS
jgi:two-component system chemotaxis response regulator CheB